MQTTLKQILVALAALAAAYALAVTRGGPRPDKITGEIEPTKYVNPATVLVIKGGRPDGNIMLGGE